MAASVAHDLSNAPSVITLTGVNKWFGQFHVLSDINLDVREGEKIVMWFNSANRDERTFADPY